MKKIRRKLIRYFAVIAIAAALMSSANVTLTYADYVINGVSLPLQESGFRSGEYYGAQRCWYFIQHIYYRIWGRFFSPYAGTDDDILRNYPKWEMRRVTASNAKFFLSQAPLGSCFRMMTSPYGSDSVSSAGRHSLILLAKSDAGCVLYHCWGGYSYVEYYTWQGFENKFRSETDFGYFKYIKCPGAEPIEYRPSIAKTDNELTITTRLTDTVEFTETKRQ